MIRPERTADRANDRRPVQESTHRTIAWHDLPGLLVRTRELLRTAHSLAGDVRQVADEVDDLETAGDLHLISKHISDLAMVVAVDLGWLR